MQTNVIEEVGWRRPRWMPVCELALFLAIVMTAF
jgi:hypothetical protein